MTEERSLTPQEVAEMLGVTDRTVIKMTEELGGYRTGRTGRFWRFPESKVRTYLRQREARERPSEA